MPKPVYLLEDTGLSRLVRRKVDIKNDISPLTREIITRIYGNDHFYSIIQRCLHSHIHYYNSSTTPGYFFRSRRGNILFAPSEPKIIKINAVGEISTLTFTQLSELEYTFL